MPVVDSGAMTVFEYVHEIPQTVEFVNGSYDLVAIKSRPIAGCNILYCLGEALLDNSCCGETRLCYALVIGEVVADQFRLTPEGRPVSLVEAIANEALATAIRSELLGAEAVSTVNFHTPPRARVEVL